MASPRVFISSTCYDLAEIRDSLVDFVASFGFEPILSERGDVFYHPDLHTHESCLGEVGNCQMLILVIGGRYGGSYVLDPRKSVVNAEYLAAREERIPVFTFVKKSVYADHHLYVTNRKKTILSQIHFPSVDQQEHALKIFDFIDQVRSSPVNNGYFPFEFGRDIASLLRKQWAGMFLDFLQKRASTDQFAVATSLLKNVSLASSKVEELVKGLYRHIDVADAEKSIESVETRSAAREFFSQAVHANLLLDFDGNIREALSNTPREGKWYEYIARVLGGTVDEVDMGLDAPLLFINVGNRGSSVDSLDPKSSYALESAKLKALFSVVAKMTNEDIAAILDEVDLAEGLTTH